jgi:hypothetical protein
VQVVEGFDILNTLSKVGGPAQDGSTFQRVSIEASGVEPPAATTPTTTTAAAATVSSAASTAPTTAAAAAAAARRVRTMRLAAWAPPAPLWAQLRAGPPRRAVGRAALGRRIRTQPNTTRPLTTAAALAHAPSAVML